MPFLLIDFPVFNPVALALGPIVIRWYALAYIVGIVLGWIYARSLVKKERLLALYRRNLTQVSE